MHLDAKIILGYKGTGDLVIAAESGEVDAIAASSLAAKQYEEQCRLKTLCTLSFSRDEILPDVPTLLALIQLSDEDKGLMEIYALKGGKIFLAPPGTPADRIEFLQAAFDALGEDEALIKSMKKADGYYGYIGVEEVKKIKANVVKHKGDYEGILVPLVDKYSS